MRALFFESLLLSTLCVIASGSAGCSATSGDNPVNVGSGGANPGGEGGKAPGSGGNGEGGAILEMDGGTDAPPDTFMNPCGSRCGTEELCDDDHLGFDDDCDGFVDEDCGCSSGQAHFCFKGDPSFHGSPGCFDGTEKCTENAQWGPCLGGVHATDNCAANDVLGCHAISTAPFVAANLKDGTGTFSANAVLGTEVWSVQCPPGVNPCPAVSGMSPPDDFQALQSGEYTVKYTKGLAGGGTESCNYPLFVGAPGLRIELAWEHDLGGTGVDLDLHVHQPNTTTPWSVDGAPTDCTWSSCVFEYLAPPTDPVAPNWFSDIATPPDPVNWFLDPIFEKNTCYFAPRGVGQLWQSLGMGCHNPRLDLDNIDCDPTIADPDNDAFCAPENVNIDFPPLDEWVRIGVHYYSNNGENYDVHPTIKVFCDGSLGAELGTKGYYTPETAITFTPADGGDLGVGGNVFWFAADVMFRQDRCQKGCVVQPVYADPATKTPLLTNENAAQSSFGPAYPPNP